MDLPHLLKSITKCLMVGTSNKLLKISDNPTPKGCIGSTSAFEFGTLPHVRTSGARARGGSV
jgi:hypothetical protein